VKCSKDKISILHTAKSFEQVLRLATLLACACILAACHKSGPTEPTSNQSLPALESIIPRPEFVQKHSGTFILSENASICINPGSIEITAIGEYLSEKLRPSTGYQLNVVAVSGPPENGNIYITTVGGDPALGEEGYHLTVENNLVTLVAHRPAGLFRGIQTIRQLLPPSIENSTRQSGRWEIETCTITDRPRFEWRGMMLDVARHFFTVENVKRVIDLIAYYKINRLHLHLSDDQGWRITINPWPNLATVGGRSAYGDDPGGFYTQADYMEIVGYAQSRYITVVPEIDMPGHMGAALLSYPILGTSSGTLDLDKETTYKFLDDVIREISAITPGLYFHVGGDEAYGIPLTRYTQFIDSIQSIVHSYGKQMVGWEEITRGNIFCTSIAQHWNSMLAQNAVERGAKVIMSPASRTYMDMRYNFFTFPGQNWAGYIEVDDGYSWDPATELSGVTEKNILGVEAPLWTETIKTMSDIEFMTFPRLPGYAEIGWSSSEGRSFDEYKYRLGAHGPRLRAMGVNFYHSPLVPWQ